MQNFILKSQTVAEKTVKNFRGPLFCRIMYMLLCNLLTILGSTSDKHVLLPKLKASTGRL